MRKQIAIALVVLVFTVYFCIAQGGPPGATADIPFSFIAEGKTLPAGPYQFTERDDPTVIVVRNGKTGESVIVPIITRLGTQAEKETNIVFDVVGNDHYLSEVRIADTDGYLLKATPGKHTHALVKGVKGKK
jgi:hypothetical protein